MKPMMDAEQHMTIAAQLAALRRKEYEAAMVGNLLDRYDNSPDAYHDMTPSYDLSPQLDEVDAKFCGVSRLKAIAVGVIAFVCIGLAVALAG